MSTYVVLTWKDPLGQAGSVQFDVVTSDTYEAVMSVTSHPVERGAPITDHARPEPVKLSLEAFVSATPLPSNLTEEERQTRVMDYLPTPLDYSSANQAQSAPIYTPGGLTQALTKLVSAEKPLPQIVNAFRAQGVMPDRPRLVFERLEYARTQRLFVSVATKYHSIDNMLIERVNVARSTESSGGLPFQVDLVQVRVASTQVVSYPVPSSPRAAPEVKKGAQVPDSFLYAPTKQAFDTVDDAVGYLTK